MTEQKLAASQGAPLRVSEVQLLLSSSDLWVMATVARPRTAPAEAALGDQLALVPLSTPDSPLRMAEKYVAAAAFRFAQARLGQERLVPYLVELAAVRRARQELEQAVAALTGETLWSSVQVERGLLLYLGDRERAAWARNPLDWRDLYGEHVANADGVAPEPDP